MKQGLQERDLRVSGGSRQTFNPEGVISEYFLGKK